MFTGLIQCIGTVSRVETRPDGRVLHIHCPELVGNIRVDDSIATNGVCLTATEIDSQGFTAHAIPVTLEKTSTGELIAGSRVNLELAMRLGDRLGGHLVQGHVNGTGRILDIAILGDNWLIRIAFPPELRRYLISEGSIAVDGISLTIAALYDAEFTVSIIPHTLQRTTLGSRSVGDTVNLETDMLAKYIENLLYADPKLVENWKQLDTAP
jgi:riboflavin synthase